jgi:DNA mismatch repair protein MutS
MEKGLLEALSIKQDPSSMKFEIDKQTLKDLNIFGASPNDKSLFSLFNATFCAGGKKKLTEFFSNPSDDITFLTERKETIAFLQKHFSEGIDLDKNSLDFAEYYYRHANFLAEVPSLYAVIMKFLNRLNNYKKFHLIDKGVLSSVKLIKSLHSFAQLLREKCELEECPQLLNERVTELLKRLDQKEYKDAIHPKRLNVFEIIQMDYVFRKTHRADLSFFLEFIYELDAYITVANTARQHGFSYPEILPQAENILQAEGLFHPMVAGAISSDVSIDAEKKLLFITGPNMAGKSTFLKALGLSAYLAHIGFPVPAKKMRISALSGISTTINLADDLALGYSHFYAEVKRIKDVAEMLESHRNMLVIFDELFRGTNVKDAYDGTLAIASAFSAVKSSFFVVSSHIVEVAEELEKKAGIQFGFFEVNAPAGDPTYTYRMKEGISNIRLGMHIINKEGLIDFINKLSK